MKNEVFFKNFIGIDVSKFKLDIYCSWNNKYLEIKNNRKSVKSFIKYLDKKEDLLVVIDLTGGYESKAVEVFCELGFNVHRAQGRKVKNFIRAYGQNAKTDKIDAYMLCEYGKLFQNKLRLYKYDKETKQADVLSNLMARLADIEEMVDFFDTFADFDNEMYRNKKMKTNPDKVTKNNN